jgi:hypothetical protein
MLMIVPPPARICCDCERGASRDRQLSADAAPIMGGFWLGVPAVPENLHKDKPVLSG